LQALAAASYMHSLLTSTARELVLLAVACTWC
jgi:hypothetical protein